MANELAITVKVLLWFLGFITALGGASAVILKFFSPLRKMKEDIANLQKDFEGLKNYQNTDHAELKKVEIGIEKLCKCTLAITDHELTGNSVDKLREAKDEMNEYLISK